MKSTLLFLLSLFILIPLAPADSPPPNVIVILADDLGYGDVSFNGCPDFSTPNIDALAANGVRCTNGYSSHPVCSPSRAGLLTGRYQHRFGFDFNPGSDPNNSRLGLPATELILPQILKPAGYVCGAIGKWHLGVAPSIEPLSRGFDEFFGFLGGASAYFDAPILDGETHIIETDYLTDAFTREATSFIDRHASQPFFLYLAYNAPHAPYQAAQQYLDRVQNISDPDRRILAAMILALDDGVGAVMQSLQAHNLLSNTVVIFLSDNGAPEKGFTRNDPLRGYKLNTLEGGMHVPFLLQWSGHIPAHSVYEQPVSALDIVTMAAALAKVPLPADRAYDGVDLMPYLTAGTSGPERNLSWMIPGMGTEGPAGSKAAIWAVRSGALKLVTERRTTSKPPALYDLSADIGEANNLAPSQPAQVAALQQIFQQWTLETQAPLFQEGTTFLYQQPSTLALAGDWNNYAISGPAPWLIPITTAPAEEGTFGTPDGFNTYDVTIHVAAKGGDTTPGTHSFAVVGGKSYANQWGGVPIAVDGATEMPFFSGKSLGPQNQISLDSGYYYSFRMLDPLKENPGSLTLAVLKTSASPVTVSRAGQDPMEPAPGDPVTVTISTDQPKSPEERVYLRWSTDMFVTSHLVEAVGDGTSYTATIPAQPADTLLQYTALTSTVDFAPTLASGAVDAMTLSTTESFNAYSAGAVPTPTPTPTPTPPGSPVITRDPADTTVVGGSNAQFTFKATGQKPLTCQWSKNGTPISGANRLSYITPPTGKADNGALFSVTVTNDAGSAVSRGALLTVTRPTAPSSDSGRSAP